MAPSSQELEPPEIPGRFNVDDVLVVSPLAADDAFKDKEFDLYFLVNHSVKERDIYQCMHRASGRRIGWMIPILALDSDQHDFRDNEHFLKYAWIALRLALTSAAGAGVRKQVDVTGRDEVSFAELFDPGTVLLVVSRETLEGACEFDIERAAASFAKFGYIDARLGDFTGVFSKMLPPKGGKFFYELSSLDVGGSSIVASLVHGASTAQSEVLRFFYLYQIIELLMERIFAEEQSKIVQELIDAAGDSSRAKDAIYKMSDVASEKRRIALLVNRYSDSAATFSGLRSACNDFLDSVGRPKGVSFEDFLYPVRNYIFHRFRQVPASALQYLTDINRELLTAIPVITSSFRVPVP